MTPNTSNRILSGALATVATGFLTLLSATAEASATEPQPASLEWNTRMQHFQIDSDKFVGQRFLFECPEHTVRDKMPEIHGTNVYSSDSPICPAAVHAGAVRRGGGRIIVQLNPGLEHYAPSKRHGVQSTALPGTKRSIIFVREHFANGLTPVQRKYAPRLKWNTKFTATGLANRKLVGQRFVFKCPKAPGELPGRRVYGTDRYAFNSYVCLAAVHAGRLTSSGGFVVVQMVEPEGKLEGSMRNGIESRSGPAGNRQLVFPVRPPKFALEGRP